MGVPTAILGQNRPIELFSQTGQSDLLISALD
jgi:hypothetical protein